MKAYLEFDLPDDEFDFEIAVCAPALASALRAVDGAMRDKLKHGNLNEEAYQQISEIRSALYEELKEEGIERVMLQ